MRTGRDGGLEGRGQTAGGHGDDGDDGGSGPRTSLR